MSAAYRKKRTSRKPFTLAGVTWLSYQTGILEYTLFSACKRLQVWRYSHRVTWCASVDGMTIGRLYRSEEGACKAAARVLPK